MFLDDLLPSQNTLFEFACNALQAGSVPSFTVSITLTFQNLENNQSSLQQITEYESEGLFRPRDLAIYLLIFLLVGLAVPIVISKFILEPCLPNLKYRKAKLIGIGFYGISMLGIVLGLTLFHQGFESIILFYPFIITFVLLGSAFHHFSRIVDPYPGIINFIVSTILVFIAAHVFPQQVYHTCTVDSLAFTFMFVSEAGICLASFNFCVFNFHTVLNSEKLFFSYSVKGKKYKGYIVKKGSEWVEVLPDEVFNL